MDEEHRKLMKWGALAVVILIAAGIEWNRSQNQPAPEFAQNAVKMSVQADLLKIARAQEFHFSEHGKYASIPDLIESGALAMKKPGRGVYVYTAELSNFGFVVTAQAEGEEAPRWPVLQINERHQVTEFPVGSPVK